MSAWIREISIKLKFNENILEFYSNNRGNIIEINLSHAENRIRIFTKDYRLSYSNERLFDFHNLQVKKGVEAKRSLIDIINPIKGSINEDLGEAKIKYDIPISLIQDFINKLDLDNFDFRNILDFNIKYFEYDLGREFIKKDPRLNTERRLKITLQMNNKCLNTTNWIDSHRYAAYISNECEKWYENPIEFRNTLLNYRTLDTRYEEIKRYIENLIRNYV